jgi:hypothetical protein
MRTTENERFHRRTAHFYNPQAVRHNQAAEQNRDDEASQNQTYFEPRHNGKLWLVNILVLRGRVRKAWFIQ